jgi:hypothetical protein
VNNKRAKRKKRGKPESESFRSMKVRTSGPIRKFYFVFNFCFSYNHTDRENSPSPKRLIGFNASGEPVEEDINNPTPIKTRSGLTKRRIFGQTRSNIE